jgi:RNase P subunit RPR2
LYFFAWNKIFSCDQCAATLVSPETARRRVISAKKLFLAQFY